MKTEMTVNKFFDLTPPSGRDRGWHGRERERRLASSGVVSSDVA
jgi:hypothetical protein